MASTPLPKQPPASVASLGQRLARERARSFVGRQREREAFRAALTSVPAPFSLLWVHGPGGVGKSSLLRCFAEIAEAAGAQALALDARECGASPEAFEALIAETLGPTASALGVHAALTAGARKVLLVDTAETLVSLEGWLREQFLPALPETCLVVIASRKAPEPAWRDDLAWSQLLRVVALQNFEPTESRALLIARGVAQELCEPLIAAARGHPLALSLFADVARQTGAPPSPLERSPDLVRALLARFSHDAPDEQHRTALYACAHARVTDEAMLRAAVSCEDARGLYDWLRSLSFVEESMEGLYLHELAADALDAELRLRDRARYSALHVRLRDTMVMELQQTTGERRLRWASDLVWLHRFHPVVRALADWEAARPLYPTSLRAADRAEIVSAARRFRGEASAALVAFWLAKQPEAFTVVRSSRNEAVGFVMSLLLTCDDREAEAHDPIVRAAFAYARAHAAPREDERIAYLCWMSYETNDEPGPMLAQVGLQCALRILTTPRLAYSFFPCPDDDARWQPVLAYLDHERGPEIAFGSTPIVLYAHDWRARPAAAVFDRAIDYEPQVAACVANAKPDRERLVLSREAFAGALRQALRDWTRPAGFGANPLLRSRIVAEHRHAEDPQAALRSAISDAIASLAQSPKYARLHAALDRTYLHPAATQELAAQRLGLPFSTYRRHLSAGLDQLAAWLWERELAGWP